MKMFVSPVEKKSRGPWMKSVASQPPERLFMDDNTNITTKVIEAT